ncbi:hypothetical protein GCM10027570_25400 [Streptomonospora sediminis]
MNQETPDRLLFTGMVAGAALVLGFLWTTDLAGWLSAPAFPDVEWGGPPRTVFSLLPFASGAIVAAAAVGLLALRPGNRVTAACATAAAAVPLAASAALAPLPNGEFFGYPFTASEAAGLLLILSVTAFRCPPLPVAGVAGVTAASFVSDRLRATNLPEAADGQLSATVLGVVAGLAAGFYLRWRAEQRRSHVARARQEERLAVARDLHDEVAHQITGIVVQVQALQHISDSAPGRAQSALPEIERSAAQALASMRRLVSALRVPDAAAPVDGNDAATALQNLQQTSAPGRPRVDVVLAGPVADLPTDVGAALVRISQEAVTNAVRHARDATRIAVDVAAGPGQVSLEVRDNGRGGASSFRGGGGHGLVGMAERARLVGGEATAGPAREGAGWRVRAELPVPGTHLAGTRE